MAFGDGIREDFKTRWALYPTDWKWDWTLFAPATYSFFTSVIPALTFGEYIFDATEGAYGGSQVLSGAAIGGIIQSIIGGQPLLIIAVPQPVVMVYIFMFNFCKDQDIPYKPFCSVTLFWAAAMMILVAGLNACNFIKLFTRFSGELFGFLIAILMVQQGLKGTVQEFERKAAWDGDNNNTLTGSFSGSGVGEATFEKCMDPDDDWWLFFNGALATLVAFGFLYLTLIIRTARDWNLFNHTFRRFLTEYATFIMVIIWTAISYAPKKTLIPENIPRRLEIQTAYSEESVAGWSNINDLHTLEGWHIGAAIIPAFFITVLFFFDHNVSAQLAQVAEFKLEKPPAYHWDFMLCGIITMTNGLLGLPPANGAIPQAPMHTRACQVYTEDPKTGKVTVKVREQRWTNLIQSIMCGGAMFATPALKTIPRSVLWGFFLFMAMDSLPGSQFYERMQLVFTDKKRLGANRIARSENNQYLDKVPWDIIMKFTGLQFFAWCVCYGITWGEPWGIIFPLFICGLVPFRKYIMCKWFDKQHLKVLDPLYGEVYDDEEDEHVEAPIVLESSADNGSHPSIVQLQQFSVV